MNKRFLPVAVFLGASAFLLAFSNELTPQIPDTQKAEAVHGVNTFFASYSERNSMENTEVVFFPSDFEQEAGGDVESVFDVASEEIV